MTHDSRAACLHPVIPIRKHPGCPYLLSQRSGNLYTALSLANIVHLYHATKERRIWGSLPFMRELLWRSPEGAGAACVTPVSEAWSEGHPVLRGACVSLEESLRFLHHTGSKAMRIDGILQCRATSSNITVLHVVTNIKYSTYLKVVSTSQQTSSCICHCRINPHPSRLVFLESRYDVHAFFGQVC